VCDLTAVLLVVHQEHLQLLGAVHEEFVEAVGQDVLGLLVGACSIEVVVDIGAKGEIVRKDLDTEEEKSDEFFCHWHVPNPMQGSGMVPLNLLLTLESIPLLFLHVPLSSFLKREYMWRSNFFMFFFTTFVGLTETTFTMMLAGL
jgi:hypothetical protein